MRPLFFVSHGSCPNHRSASVLSAGRKKRRKGERKGREERSLLFPPTLPPTHPGAARHPSLFPKRRETPVPPGLSPPSFACERGGKGVSTFPARGRRGIAGQKKGLRANPFHRKYHCDARSVPPRFPGGGVVRDFASRRFEFEAGNGGRPAVLSFPRPGNTSLFRGGRSRRAYRPGYAKRIENPRKNGARNRKTPFGRRLSHARPKCSERTVPAKPHAKN